MVTHAYRKRSAASSSMLPSWKKAIGRQKSDAQPIMSTYQIHCMQTRTDWPTVYKKCHHDSKAFMYECLCGRVAVAGRHTFSSQKYIPK
jgi:hypothetical protein